LTRTTPKIRINELARELEVKASEILAMLPEIGVNNAKTHSSSVDSKVAVKIRVWFGSSQSDTPDPEPALVELDLPIPEVSRPKQARPAISTSGKRLPSIRSMPPTAGGSLPLRPPVQALRPPLKKETETGSRSVGSLPTDAPKPSTRQDSSPTTTLEKAGESLRSTSRIDSPTVKQPPNRSEVLSERTPISVHIPTHGTGGRSSSPLQSTAQSQTKSVTPTVPGASLPLTRPLIPRGGTKPATPTVPGASLPLTRPLIPRGGTKPATPTVPGASLPLTRPLIPRGGTKPATPPAPARPSKREASSTPTHPVVVPGKPIYQRPKKLRSVRSAPGMPTPRPNGGTKPGMPRQTHPISRPGFTPGAQRPGFTPGAQRPGFTPGAQRPRFDQRRGPRPGPRQTQVRDREAEREEKLLRRQASKAAQAPPVAVNKEITISEGMTLKVLAEKLGLKANIVIKTLVDRGLFATINQTLDSDTIKDLAKHFGATTTEVTFEEETLQEVDASQEASNLTPRAPVVTVMGHVDHGKTSLLDAIRKTNVAEREAGGITQAIGAYQVSIGDRKIAFVDTPGHEAFTSMRARGASVTDIVILVVAADDGVMPQTIEAIDHAKSADVPIVVAINKIDKAGSEPDRVKQQLADRGLLPEEWGGDTVMVSVSAQTKENLPQLLEMVLLVSDLKELKANPSRPAVGTVLEAKLERGQGPVATVLVQNGTLRVSDYFVVGSVFGKVRALVDDRGLNLQEAPPSSVVVVLGLDGTPKPGDQLQVVTDTEKAKKIVGFRENKAREQAMAKNSRLSLDQFQEQLRTGQVEELSLLLKADVQGSVEVLSDTLEKISNDQVRVRIIRAGVGAISKSDVLLATAANAIIVGFNIRPERTASTIAEQEKVDIRLYTVIYELVDEIKRAMAGLLEPITKETSHGRVEVLDIFHITKLGTIGGSRVEEGRITRKSEVRLLRDNIVVYTGRVASLRRFKDEATEVRSGQECGVGLENYNDIKKGDIIEAFETEKVAQEILT